MALLTRRSVVNEQHGPSHGFLSELRDSVERGETVPVCVRLTFTGHILLMGMGDEVRDIDDTGRKVRIRRVALVLCFASRLGAPKDLGDKVVLLEDTVACDRADALVMPIGI